MASISSIIDDLGGELCPVLKAAIATLNHDLVNFLKLFAGTTPADKAASASLVCVSCDKLKKQYEEATSENINKAKRITSLETQIARLEDRLSSNGGGYRPPPHRGGSVCGGYHRGGARDSDRDHDRDRDRDHDRDRDAKSRQRAEPSSRDTKTP